MHNYQFVEREVPLIQCPNLSCRRAHACLNEVTGLPCMRTHESADDFRYRLAEKLDRIRLDPAAERLPPLPPGEAGEYEADRRMGELKRGLEALDSEFTAREMAARK